MNKLKAEIIFESNSFVAVNKPSGLLSIPDREGKDITLKHILELKYGQIWTVHRLDKDTSGIMVFARDQDTHKLLSGLFERREVEKYYLGIVHGKPTQEAGTIDMPIMEHSSKKGFMMVHKKGKPALTDYLVMETFGHYTLMQFRIHTGRTHQIRVHMKHIGHPIVCDPSYGDGEPVLLSFIKKKYHLSKKHEEERPLIHRLALHAERLVFTDSQKRQHAFDAPLPKDLKAFLQQLRKWKGT